VGKDIIAVDKAEALSKDVALAVHKAIATINVVFAK